MLGPCCWCYRFEDELTLKFGGGTQNREIGNEIEEIDRGDKSSSNASDIQKTYERKLAAHQGRGSEEKDGSKYLAVPGAGFNFHRIISSCFEPCLTVYVGLEEKTLMENLEKLVRRRRIGILRREVRIMFYLVACSCFL